MHGLGDNIYQRAFVREIADIVFLQTSWPQLYRDLPNVRPVMGVTRLRTQRKNIVAQGQGVWFQAPRMLSRKIHYNFRGFPSSGATILGSMARGFGVQAKVFDLPRFERFEVDFPYAVVRPATVREEWKNPARNPRAEYIAEAAGQLRARGLKVISVADLALGAEWADGPLPPCDLAYYHGELGLERLLGLIQGATVVVGGVGWIVPAAIAAGVPLITLLGGQGGHNDPSRIVGAPMDLSRARWIRPDNYCSCKDMRHGCDKRISDFSQKFEEALDGLCLARSLATA